MSLQPAPLPLPPAVGVTRARGEFRVVATGPISPGEIVFHMEGPLVPGPSRYTVQVAANGHLDPWEDRDLTWVLDHRPYAFLNHSCAPNTRIVGRDVVAVRAITAGADVTFDYRTTERALAEPFRCRCGHCGGAWIRGYAFLTPAERATLAPLLAAHARA